jgi:hypothetical protein
MKPQQLVPLVVLDETQAMLSRIRIEPVSQ